MASPDTDSVFDKPADTDSSIMSFVDITRREGPRYSEFQAAPGTDHRSKRGLRKELLPPWCIIGSIPGKAYC